MLTGDWLSDEEIFRIAINVAHAESGRLGVEPEELYSYAWEATGVAKTKPRHAKVPFKAWLIRVVRWELEHSARRLRTFGPRSNSRIIVQSLPEWGDEWCPVELSTDTAAQCSDARLSLERAASTLTDHQRDVLRLHYGEGYQLNEISRASKHTHTHAIRKLRRALGIDERLPIFKQLKPKTSRGRRRAGSSNKNLARARSDSKTSASTDRNR